MCKFQSAISLYFPGPGSRGEIPDLEWPGFCAWIYSMSSQSFQTQAEMKISYKKH